MENIQREDLAPLEIATALQLFVEQGWKQKDIAQRLGKTVPFVSSHLSLLKLPEPVMALYEQGVTQDTETLNNLRQLYELNAKQGEQLCTQAVNHGISRVQSREALNALKKPVSAKSVAEPKPEKTTRPKSADNQEWRSVKPSQLHLQVLVQVDGEALKGALLTDRCDQDSSYVWVQFTDGQILRVAASQLRLEKMSTR